MSPDMQFSNRNANLPDELARGVYHRAVSITAGTQRVPKIAAPLSLFKTSPQKKVIHCSNDGTLIARTVRDAVRQGDGPEQGYVHRG